jgi:hypothetical protein
MLIAILGPLKTIKMKKLLLLLLIVPFIGKSQTLDLPIAGIFQMQGHNLGQMTVPSGQVWQWVGMSTYNKANVNEYSAINWQNHFGGYVEKYHLFTGGQNLTVDWGTSSDFSTGGDCQDCYFTFIQYDLTPTENEKNEETTVSLNIPVSEVINIVGNDFFYGQTNGIYVPNGKVLQLVGIAGGQDSDWANFRVNNNNISFEGKLEVGFVFSSVSEVYLTNDNWYNSLFSFVMYDLDTQNLAYNVPNQITPTLYPNPTSSLLALNSDKEYDIEVYDMAGNKVMALTGNNINMAHLSTATYIVKATDKSNNEELTYKVVKN